MKHAYIQAKRGALPIERACRLLKVLASGYYAWQTRQAQPQPRSDALDLVEQIRHIFEDSRATYGSSRVTAGLRQQGTVCNRKQVAQLIRQHHLVVKHHCGRRVKTTDSRHPYRVAPSSVSIETSASSVPTRNE
jgi:putative transposase